MQKYCPIASKKYNEVSGAYIYLLNILIELKTPNTLHNINMCAEILGVQHNSLINHIILPLAADGYIFKTKHDIAITDKGRRLYNTLIEETNIFFDKFPFK